MSITFKAWSYLTVLREQQPDKVASFVSPLILRLTVCPCLNQSQASILKGLGHFPTILLIITYLYDDAVLLQGT